MNDIQVLQVSLAVLIVLCAIAVYTLSQQLTQTNHLLSKLLEVSQQPPVPPFSFQPLSFAFGMDQEGAQEEEDKPEPETKINIEPKLQEDTTTTEEAVGK